MNNLCSSLPNSLLSRGDHSWVKQKPFSALLCSSPSIAQFKRQWSSPLESQDIWDLLSLELLSFLLYLNCFSFTGSLHRYLETVRLSRSSSLLVTHQMVSFPIHRYQSLIVCECILPWAQQYTLYERHCKNKSFLSWGMTDCWMLKKEVAVSSY